MVNEYEPHFHDREDAGKQLAERLAVYRSCDTAVLAVPRGGIPVAIEVAKGLNALFDIVVVRKITIPYNPEAGYGAITEDSARFLNAPLVAQLGLTMQQIEDQAKQVLLEIKRRNRLYRETLPGISLYGRTVVVIDDGLASGYTMVAAIKSIQQRKAAKVIAASPVSSGKAYELIKPLCDELVCLVVSNTYPFAVASFYHHWHDLTDEEVGNYIRTWQAGHKVNIQEVAENAGK